jgi:hypothetical protein
MRLLSFGRHPSRLADSGGLPPEARSEGGGDGGIRTLDRALQPYNGLANRRLQPLGHVSNKADMPDAAASRKRQILRLPNAQRNDSGASGGGPLSQSWVCRRGIVAVDKKRSVIAELQSAAGA